MPRLSKIGAAALAAFGWTTGAAAVTASYLQVAGGGGSSFGGGGAGGYLAGAISLNLTLSYTVTVGAGGAQAISTAAGTNGGNSSITGLTASVGGGGGGALPGNGVLGGSGGGGVGSGTSGGAATSGQGNAGGAGTAATFNAGGGGGGSGGVGGNSSGGTTGGNAGIGTASSISGTSVTYAGGGSGASTNGGGQGSTTAGGGSAANLGGGGNCDGAAFSNGGSGVVIISYVGAQQFGGGIVTSSGGYTIHTFNTSGTLSPLSSLTANYLIVAGGGSGADYGGGGAGGLRSTVTNTGGGGSLESALTIDTNSTYLVTVGAGGTGGSVGTNGSNSTFLSISSTGGGRGANNTTPTVNGSSGGSGGGGRWTGGTGGAGTTNQGFAGGNGGAVSGSYPAGGGGGAGAVGGNGTSGGNGGAGGAGVASSISGSSVTYAGGGGGGCAPDPSSGVGGAGGSGGGGTGGTSGSGQTAGSTNTGSGGGGAGYSGSSGGAGGSGVVIISYAGATQLMAGGTVTVAGGNVIHTFTSSGYLAPIYSANNSLRFRKSANGYLSRTMNASSTTYTVSAWVKRGLLSGYQYIFASGPNSASNDKGIAFDTSTNQIYAWNGSSQALSTAVFRDPAAWYHVVMSVNSGTASVYVNNVNTGISQSSMSLGTYGRIGRFNDSSSANDFDGYMAEFNLIDGQALTPNSFGTFNGLGVWQPIRYGGSYGTNGFYLPFPNDTTGASLSANYLVVAGGGGGGRDAASGANNAGGGGGAGGYLASTTSLSATQSYIITVGAGGAGGGANSSGSSGSNSVFNALTSIGGGGGARNTAGLSGGSGGGGAASSNAGGAGTSGQGNNGGSANGFPSGGGGGAGAVGNSGSGTNSGGAGLSSSISGSSVTYAGGGGGAQYNGAAGAGGAGGGGAGSVNAGNATSGTANTGGGGGGVGSDASGVTGSSGSGGSGIVIVSYAGGPRYTGGTITSSGGNTIHTFTSSGVLTSVFNDFSPNGNNWTGNNINVSTLDSTYDSMTDVPTLTSATAANYAVLNPLSNSYTGTTVLSITDGNLNFSDSSSSNRVAIGSMTSPTGKWYFEMTSSSTGTYAVGLMDKISNAGSFYRNNGAYSSSFGGGGTFGYSSWTTGDVIGVAWDADAGKLWFAKNNTWQSGSPSAGTSPTNTFTAGLSLFADIYTDNSAGTKSGSFNFGQRPFVYTPPTGFNRLNTFNLPTPTIGATAATTANKYFNAVTYTGAGAGTVITSGFYPDFAWMKNRTAAFSNFVQDSVRGGSLYLLTNTTDADATISPSSTFSSTGITINGLSSYASNSSYNYVLWAWKANAGTNVSNTAGSITSTVSANTTAGFSVVTYTGTGANATVGHGLGVAPSMVILKARNATEDWIVYHSSIGATNYLQLNLTSAASSGSGTWNSTAPTSSVFSLGNAGNTNGSGFTFVAYCFAPIAGYSAFGSYTSNNSTDGPFIYTGFRPRYVLIKAYSNAGESWNIFDSARGSYNVNTAVLFADASSAEATNSSIDFLSNGFKLRSATGGVNYSSYSYIYMAFAENPFKYSNAR